MNKLLTSVAIQEISSLEYFLIQRYGVTQFDGEGDNDGWFF